MGINPGLEHLYVNDLSASTADRGSPVRGGRLDEAQRQQLSSHGAVFQKETGSKHCLVLVGPMGLSTVGLSTEDSVKQACAERFGEATEPSPREDRAIDVILDSPGGSLDSAYRTVLYLTQYAKTLRVFVPRRAKSASTLVAVGATELHLSRFGELGPLDAQIRDPRNPAEFVSALDCYQSVDYVTAFGLDTLGKTLGNLVQVTQARIPLVDLVSIASEFATKSTSPLVSQINGLDYGTWARNLRIGQMYAETLMTRAQPLQQRTKEIASKLVFGYTHHLFPIDLVEARRIGLPVEPMSDGAYSAANKIVLACEDKEFVGFLKPHVDVSESTPAPRAVPDAEAAPAETPAEPQAAMS